MQTNHARFFMIPPSLVIRADAGSRIGTGHVMRCLALAQALRIAGTRVTFVLTADLPLIEDRLKEEGMETIQISASAGTPADAIATAAIAKDCRADWIVVDGYSFAAEYQKTIRNAGLSLLFIDDYGHSDHYFADIVLNQNLYADQCLYPTHEPRTRFLLGPDFVLLRKEFRKMSCQDRKVPAIARKILVTLGGSDPDNITLRVIEALKSFKIDDIRVVVVIGGANPYADLIDRAVSGSPSFTVLKNAANMPELMAWADVAISAGGSTCWELLFMGVPSIVISIAENQEPVARELDSRSLACVLSLREVQDPHFLIKRISGFLNSRELRAGFAEKMTGYIDGNGPTRVIHAMYDPIMFLRKAEPTDCEMVWEWINDPEVRSASFTPDPIPLVHHRSWFSAALSDPDLAYYIAQDQDRIPIGQARFRIEGGDATISVLVAPGHQRKSWGTQLIRHATEKLFAETRVEKVKAFIKTGNEVSKRVFARAGYEEHGQIDHNGERAFLFIKLRGR